MLLVIGWQELGARKTTVFVVLWLGARVGLSSVANGSWFFTPVVAILDIVLVLMIYKRDFRLG